MPVNGSMEEEPIDSPFGLEDGKVEACMTHIEFNHSTDDDMKPIISNSRALVLYEGDAITEPHEGMEFDSEEDARIFYSTYARHVGFRTRISKYSRSRHDNSIISRRFVCSKEGFREVRVRNCLFGERKQRQRAVTRVGCKAMIMVKKMDNGKWVVSRFTKEHNHGPVPPKKLEVSVTCDNNDSKEGSLFSEGDIIQEPFEGMEFESEDAAKTFYSIYAMHMGFSARISKYCRSRRDHSVISRQIVCSKEGFREVRAKKEFIAEARIRRPRVITRIGCKAMIAVKKLSSGRWIVTKFEKEHNHVLGTSRNALHLQSDTKSGELLAVTGRSQAPIGEVINRYHELQGASRDSLTVLYNKLCHEAIKFAQEGAVSEDIYNVAMSALKEAVEKVAAAKRGNVGVSIVGHSLNGIDGKDSKDKHSGPEIRTKAEVLHPIQSGNKAKPASHDQKLVILEQPVKFVLVPSTSAAGSPTIQSVESPFILNLSDSHTIQSQLNAKHSACSSQSVHILNPTGRKRELQAADEDQHNGTIQRPKKLDTLGLGQAQAAVVGNESKLVHPVLSEAELVAIPAVPVAICMPVMTNVPTSRSAPKPGSPSNPCTLVGAPIEALPGSTCSADTHVESTASSPPAAAIQEETQSLDTTSRSPKDHSKLYTGPNPQVHATALAVGARVLPPKAAASLIKAVESRIRSARASLAVLAFTDDPKPCISTPQTPPRDSETDDCNPMETKSHNGD